MKVSISFKNLEHTPALDEKIKEKTHKLEKYLDGNTDVHWVCSTQEGQHYADIKLSGPSFQYNASADSDNLYKTLDLAVSKMEKQLQRKKEKWKNKIHSKHNINQDENLIKNKKKGRGNHEHDYDEELDEVG
ncbi:MAG: ribosome-associated translation inhibitor RaiA [Oligoflexia bacterium]|nr:ribosome-associated translation inhibitor RaiA [Oligoflexia bacterium]